MAKNGLSEAKKRSNLKWDAANLKRLSLAMPIGSYEKMRLHIEKLNTQLARRTEPDSKKLQTQNRFINEAIEEKIANDEANMQDDG